MRPLVQPVVAVTGLSGGMAMRLDSLGRRRLLPETLTPFAEAPVAVRRVRGGWVATCLGGCGRERGGPLLSDALRASVPHSPCIRGVLVVDTEVRWWHTGSVEVQVPVVRDIEALAVS